MRAAALLLLTAGLAAEPSLEARVNEAIDRGAAWLEKKQAEDGSWGAEDAVHPLGRTALATYTLLHAGYAKDDPAIEKAVAFLGVAEGPVVPHSTYEAGCLLLCLHALGDRHRARIHEICDWLVENFNRSAMLWGYPGGSPDLSNTQYAVLGLKVGELHGYEAPKRLWKALVRGVLRLQHESGGFAYRDGTLYRATMTHAALLVLLFATQSLGRADRDAEEAIERGHEWYARNFRVDSVPWGRGWGKPHFYYYLYGLERYAQFFGKEEIGGRDWYREGAEELLSRQKKRGEWGRIEETCFAILFLHKVTFTASAGRKRGEAKEKPADPPERPKPDPKVPFVREWLVAGPYPARTKDDSMLFTEHFKLARARPAPGARAGTRRWEVHQTAKDELDLKEALGGPDFCAYYAAVYLHAREAAEAVLWLGTDDGCKVFLDGGEVLDGHHHDYSGDDYYRVPLALDAGRHLLVVKVENIIYYCRLRARIEAPDAVAVSVGRKPQ